MAIAVSGTVLVKIPTKFQTRCLLPLLPPVHSSRVLLAVTVVVVVVAAVIGVVAFLCFVRKNRAQQAIIMEAMTAPSHVAQLIPGTS